MPYETFDSKAASNVGAAHEAFIDEFLTHEGNEQHFVAAADDAPASGTYELLEHMINNGTMIQNNQFTDAGLDAIMDYIQNGPANYGSIVGDGAVVRASYVQSLLNARYATGHQPPPRLDGPAPFVPGQFEPFSVQFRPGFHRPDGNRLGTVYTPPSLSISQTVNGRRNLVAVR